MTPASPWYEEGLRFACTQCGYCCTTTGYVWVTRREAQRLADRLDLELEEFGRRYLRLVRGRHALIDREDGACIFWDEGCKVYSDRPGQCRTFPFWKENVADSDAWRETGDDCEGIGEGRLYTIGEIRSLVDGRSETVSPAEEDAFDSTPIDP